jgi:UDP-N-acetylglucosamine 2-epimerase
MFSDEEPFSPVANNTEDQLAVVASAQKLVEANEKVLDQLEERTSYEQKLEEAVADLQKQNASILKTLQELKRD